MPASWHSSSVDRQTGMWCPHDQVRGLRAGLRPVTGPRPHVRRQLALGDRPAARAFLGLRHVLGHLRRRRRPDVGDLMAALRRHRLAGQARPAPAARRRREPNRSSGSSTSFIVVPGSPGCLPGRRLPRSRSDRSRASSYTGCPTTAAATTRTNPSPPAARAASTRADSPSTCAVSSPISRYASASRAASSAGGSADSSSAEGTRAHRAQQAKIIIPARQSTTHRDVSRQRIRHAMNSHKTLTLAEKLRRFGLAASRVEDCSNGFDFHQLVFVAEDGHAHQGARGVVRAERVPDYFPGGH